MRVTGFLTNTTRGGPGRQLADLELRHRRHARVEDRIRAAKNNRSPQKNLLCTLHAAGRVRADRRQGRRTPDPAGDPRHRPRPDRNRACRADLDRKQNYHGRAFEATLADAGVGLLRPARKGQLDLEQHGGHTPSGVWVRVVQRVLALTAGIWHNDRTGRPIKRSLLAYDQ
jgi:hypothetical protein